MKAKKPDQRQLSANVGSTIRGRVTAKAGYFGALQLAGSVAQYAALGAAELQEATHQFDEPMVVKQSRPLNARERRLWEKGSAQTSIEKGMNAYGENQ